jgi:DNA-binding protein HU-beta
MNKSELIDEVANTAGITKKAAGEAVDAVLKAVETTLTKGEKLTLVGFGTFETISRAERTGRNPKTGEEIKIPAKKSAKFKPGSSLTKQINS